MDDEIYKSFRDEFPEFNVRKINEGRMKVRFWTAFCRQILEHLGILGGFKDPNKCTICFRGKGWYNLYHINDYPAREIHDFNTVTNYSLRDQKK